MVVKPGSLRMIIVLRELSRSDTIHGTSPVVQKFKRFRIIPFRELTPDSTCHIIRRMVSKIGLKRNSPPNDSQRLSPMWLSMNSLGRNCPSNTSKLTSFNPKVLAPDFNIVSLDPDGLVHDKLAGGHIILPSVPRAGNRDSLELTLAKRASAVQTRVIDCVKLVSYVRDSHSQAVDLKFTNRTRRDLIFSRSTHETHSPTPSADFRNCQAV